LAGQVIATNEKMKSYTGCWNKVAENLIDEDLIEISSEDYLNEKNMRKLVNL